MKKSIPAEYPGKFADGVRNIKKMREDIDLTIRTLLGFIEKHYSYPSARLGRVTIRSLKCYWRITNTYGERHMTQQVVCWHVCGVAMIYFSSDPTDLVTSFRDEVVQEFHASLPTLRKKLLIAFPEIEPYVKAVLNAAH